MQENTQIAKSGKEKTLGILKIIGNVVFYLVIFALLLFSIMNINAGSKNGGFPNIFGKGFLSVQTNSMTRDDSFSGNDELKDLYAGYAVGSFASGDLVLVDVANENNVKALRQGDVITFFDTSIKALNTHRIVNISFDENGNIINIAVQGDLSVSTLGKYDPTDASKASLNNMLLGRNDVQILSADDVEGIVTGVSYGSGKIIDNIHKNWLWYFVVPVLVFLLVEVYFVIRNIMELKGAKQQASLALDKEAMMAELEKQKEEMRKQILAEMAAEQARLQQEAANQQTEEEPKEE